MDDRLMANLFIPSSARKISQAAHTLQSRVLLAAAASGPPGAARTVLPQHVEDHPVVLAALFAGILSN